ncbi:hypothetical protein [Escherichia coli]|uniref:hypothetical protein n=1 Tax=Escherichia coli TaxID=562 RepID=UPI001C406BC3|nr:hypothetical protein [Escherichia coli]
MIVLTKKEKAWVERLNKLLAECPSERIGFATCGDCDVALFDATRHDDILELVDRGKRDFLPAAHELGVLCSETLVFPAPVEGVAG